MMCCGAWVNAQTETPVASIDIPAQNMLKFNRFLINPTFSTVNEDKSYLNLYHRNQWVKFDDNYQTYLGSYSGRIGDRMGVGLSIYHQKFATISNFGIMANYAYGVRLAEKSNLTFGFNLSYYNSGLDQSDLIAVQPDDPRLMGLDGSSMLSFQPGVNLSLGSFDVGLYAENLFDYNLKTSSSLTEFSEKTYTGHLMYTRKFEQPDGLFENGRFSVLSRARSIAGDEVNLSGSLILDLPKLGWVQTGYDDFYGFAAGLGFNLTDRISLGYTFEKGIEDQVSNFGVTHEVNFAYSFTPTLTENRVFEDTEWENQLVYSEEEVDEAVEDKDAEIARLRAMVEENNMIIEEMMFRQDSLEEARQKDIDRRFAYMQKFVKDYANRDNQQEMNEKINKFKKDMDEGVAFTEPTIDTDKYKKYEPKVETPVSYAKATPEKSPEQKAAPAVAVVKKEPAKAIQTKTAVADSKPVAKPGLTSTTTTQVEGASKGYYLIANVFRQKQYLDKFLGELKQKGIEANYFKKNGLHYVYLDRYEAMADARQAYASGMQGRFDGKAWVLRVKNDDPKSPYTKQRLAGTNTAKGKLLAVADKEETRKDYGDYIDRQREIISECTDQYVYNLIRPYRAKRERERKVLLAAKPAEQVRNTKGPDGYYIVANVFRNDVYAEKFVDSLKKQGIEANIYINPRNNYKYVYLQKYDSWRKAVVSYRSDVNDTYEKDIWIMPVGSS